jgi:DNA polymerase III subunit beta
MKLKILQENLNLCLSFLQKAIPNKPQLPILSSILVETKDNKIIFSATDLYLGIKTQSIAEIEEEGKIVIPGDIFKQIITSFQKGKVSLDTKDNNLQIKLGKSNMTIPTQTVEEYPEFPIIKGNQFTFSLDLLKEIEKHVSFSAGIDQTRPILTAVYFIFGDDGLEVVGTDGFRLSILNSEHIKNKVGKKLLIPAKALSEVIRIASQSKTEKILLTVSEELKQIKFDIEDTHLFVRLIEGDYPPYQKIIPSNFAINFGIDGEKFAEEIKRAFILARDSSNIVKLKITGETLSIVSSSPSLGNYKGQIDIKNKSKTDGEIAFNAKYVMEFLNNTKPEHILFFMNESLKPAMFKIDGIDNFKYIIMPFRVNN